MENYKHNFDGIAAMHTVGGIDRLNGDDGPDGLPGTHKNILRDELRDLGIDTVIVNSGEGSYDRVKKGEPVITAYPTSGSKEQGIILGKPQDFQLGPGGILAERTFVELPSKLDDYIATLNNPDMIRVSYSKWFQYQQFPHLIPRTVAIEADQVPTPEMIEPLIGNELFVKADASSASKHVRRSIRSEVGSKIAGIRAQFAEWEVKTNVKRRNKRIVVQESVFGQKWDELVGINDKYKQMLKSENGEEQELRIGCYRDKEGNIGVNQRYYAIGRVKDKDDRDVDNWAQIDQESVPREAWLIAEEVSDKLMEITNSKAAYLVVDVIKGIDPETGEMRYYVREINTDNPLMADPNEDYRDAIMQRHLLANAMATVIKSESSPEA